MKTCKKCGIEKPLEEFYKQKSAKDGHRTRCKVCTDEYTNEYNKKNRERLNEKSRENRANDPTIGEKQRAKHKERMENDPEYAEKIREKNRESQRRWKENINNRVIHNLRTRLTEYASGKRTDYRNKYTSKTRDFLGCSIEEFRKHLEENWKKGMSWENYGEWHVDHIRPVKSFDMTDEAQQRECFHWTNLQPLWAMDNFRKSSKWDGE
jgi:hypothetical protein